jgi:hypothetical protein
MDEVDPIDVGDAPSPQRDLRALLARKTPPQERKHSPGPLVSRDGLTVSRFGQWLVKEANHATAEEERQSDVLRDAQRHEYRLELREARQKRTQEVRAQQQKTAEALKQVREAAKAHGTVVRSRIDERQQRYREAKIAELEHRRSITVPQFGAQQRRRALSAQREVFEKRRAAAMRAREDAKRRVAAARIALRDEDEEKRRELDRRRSEARNAGALVNGMTSEGMEARDFFAKQRIDAAQAVRSAVHLWEREHRSDREQKMARAQQKHDAVARTRKHASASRASLIESRHLETQAMRQAAKESVSDRKTLVLATAAKKRDQAQELYNKRFVANNVAEVVANTGYGAPELILSGKVLESVSSTSGLLLTHSPSMVSASSGKGGAATKGAVHQPRKLGDPSPLVRAPSYGRVPW